MKLYRNYTVDDFKKVDKYFCDDDCRALMNYYEFVEPDAAGEPEDLFGVWEPLGNYEDAAELNGFKVCEASESEIKDFVENVLTKRDDVKVAYYYPGDVVLMARKWHSVCR